MGRPARILIVEDQYVLAVDCELQLRAAGFECVGLATSAVSALDLAELERPDIILMDVHLANRADGVQAAIVVYQRFGIRCIFASAHTDVDPALRGQAERAHPLGWLEKPYTGEALVKAVADGLVQLSCEPPAAAATQSSSSSVH